MATNETVDININVENNIQPTIAELKKLKLQIKETADPAEFKKLTQQYNDMEDAIKSARTGADNFAEVLGTLPGPIGNIGSAVGGTLQSLKQFGALKFADIKTSFVELGKDVLDAAKGILKLTGITKLYEITTIATAKVLRFFKIEVEASTLAVKLFSGALVATGIGAIVVALGFLVSAFMNTGDEADTAATKVARLNAELQNTERVSKLRNAEEIARAKKLGATETELFNIKQKQTQEQLDLARKTYKLANGQMMSAEVLYGKDSKGFADAQKLKSEAAIKIDELKSQLLVDGYNEEDRLRKEGIAKDEKAAQQGAAAIAKRKAEKKQEAADLKKILEEIAKNEKAAALSLLDEREQEKRKIVDDYNEKITLATQNGADTVILEEAKLNALKNLKDKFAKEDADKQKEIDDKKYEDQQNRDKYLYDQLQKLKDLEQQRADTTFATNQAIGQSWVDLGQNIAGVFGNLIGVFEEGSDLSKAFGIAQVAISTAASIGTILLSGKQQQADYNKAIAAGNSTIGIGIANAFIPGMQALAVGQLASGKAAVAGAIAGKAISKTNTITQVAAAGLAGATQIAAILSAGKSKSAGSGGAASSGGGEQVAPTYAGAPTMSTPQITGTEAATPGSQIAQTIAMSSGKPVKAYVVSGDISSQQALDRKTNRGATFGLG